MDTKRICICVPQVPFVYGGAEVLVETLQKELVNREFMAEIVRVPFKWYPKSEILRNAMSWRLLDLTESEGQKIDLVICTKFPSYVIKHPNKVTWLVHQMRAVYDLYGTEYSDYSDSNEDNIIKQNIVNIDNTTIAESQRVYAISQNVANRLQKFNQISSEVLYPPPHNDGLYRNDRYGDYILYVGRLDSYKRPDLLIESMSLVKSGVRCLIAGSGGRLEELRKKVQALGLQDRVQLLGFVSNEQLLELYANACAIFYAPVDEDYGLVTVEAFKSEKPVITTCDAGGVLEFVQDGVDGFVTNVNLNEIAAKIDILFQNKDLCAKFGQVGKSLVSTINWDSVIKTLTTGS